MWLGIITTVLGLIFKADGPVSEWVRRKQEIERAKVDATVQEIVTKGELAAYRLKAEVEWDLKWADAAATSWKDEWLTILWSIPLVLLFIPGLNGYVMEGFERLKYFHEDAGYFYMAGWAIIFAATFGMKSATSLMLPRRTAAAIGAMAGAGDDIPDNAAASAQAKANEIIERLNADPEAAPRTTRQAQVVDENKRRTIFKPRDK